MSELGWCQYCKATTRPLNAALANKPMTKTPCDVFLPPATLLGAGCSIETLFRMLDLKGRQKRFSEERPRFIRDAAQAVSIWRSIDIAPRDGSHVLLYEQGHIYRGYWVPQPHDEDSDDGYWGSQCGQHVTETPEPELWMAMPPLPAGDKYGSD